MAFTLSRNTLCLRLHLMSPQFRTLRHLAQFHQASSFLEYGEPRAHCWNSHGEHQDSAEIPADHAGFSSTAVDLIFYQIPGQVQTNEMQEIPPRSVQLSICGYWIVFPISAQIVQIPVTTHPPSSPLMSQLNVNQESASNNVPVWFQQFLH
jgi:hypothetical protein